MQEPKTDQELIQLGILVIVGKFVLPFIGLVILGTHALWIAIAVGLIYLSTFF